MSLNSNTYIIGFAGAVCIVCSLFVSGAAVSLKEKQQENAKLDLQKNIISVSGLIPAKKDGKEVDVNAEIATFSADKIKNFFKDKDGDSYIQKQTIDITDGTVKELSDEEKEKANKECLTADGIEGNKAKISCHQKYHDIYKVYKGKKFERYVFPVVGKGLWSTLKGFAAVDREGERVVGLTFYSHGETPGLGGEIDSANFKNDWINEGKGRIIYKGDKVALKVAKGKKSNEDHEVDGLSGATLTGNGVTGMMEFWFGEHGYQKFLKKGGA